MQMAASHFLHYLKPTMPLVGLLGAICLRSRAGFGLQRRTQRCMLPMLALR